MKRGSKANENEILKKKKKKRWEGVVVKGVKESAIKFTKRKFYLKEILAI